MTAPNVEVGAAIAERLVGERLIACANIVPRVRSIYRWRGKVCDDSEVLLLMKTTSTAVKKAIQRAAQLHPYEVPELLQLEVAAGHLPYLAWVEESVSPRKPRSRTSRR